jgi:protein TonB
MVPPEEIEELNAPTTLPADFGEWDRGDAPAIQPAKPAIAHVAVPPVVERAQAPVSRTSAAAYAETEQVFQPSKAKADKFTEIYKDESKGGKKKLLSLIGAGSLTFVLVLGFMTYSRMRSVTLAPKPPVAQQQVAANTPQQAVTNTPASAPAPTPTPAATGDDRQRAQSEMMSHQLNAPSRIPSDLKMLAGKEPPPGFAASGMEGLGGGGVAGNVFNGQNAPRVKVAAPSKVSISAGVAGGLLLQKTSPVYPQIAREARVSGTVVIQATISKTGVIENLRAVSGPTMLRQSALDAVKTWRYKPYMLDGDPVDVETTVSVTFSLGG